LDIFPSLSLLFLSSYALSASFIQMLIQCDAEPKCPQTRTKIRYSTARRLLQYYQSDKIFRDISRVIWNFSRHFEIFMYFTTYLGTPDNLLRDIESVFPMETHSAVYSRNWVFKYFSDEISTSNVDRFQYWVMQLSFVPVMSSATRSGIVVWNAE